MSQNRRFPGVRCQNLPANQAYSASTPPLPFTNYHPLWGVVDSDTSRDTTLPPSGYDTLTHNPGTTRGGDGPRADTGRSVATDPACRRRDAPVRLTAPGATPKRHAP